MKKSELMLMRRATQVVSV